MAKNAVWRRSLSGWTEILNQWLGNAVSENILKGSMFFDLRTLYGDPSLEAALKAHVAERLHRDATFLVRTAANVLRFPPPLGWFGRIKVERKGAQDGLLEVKKAGIFAITEGVKVLALESGILYGGTRERLRDLVTASVLSPEAADDLEASYNFLVFVRLRGQVDAIRRGQEPTNLIALDQLNRMEKGRLRLALEGVRSFQEFLGRHFHLDLVR
jgi:CBS domain-containing protein